MIPNTFGNSLSHMSPSGLAHTLNSPVAYATGKDMTPSGLKTLIYIRPLGDNCPLGKTVITTHN
jgi:hypothetical protein